MSHFCPSFGCTLRNITFLNWGSQHTVHQVESYRSRARGRVTSLDLLAMFCLLQLRIRLVLWAACSYHWLISNFLFDQYRQALLYRATLNLFFHQSVLILEFRCRPLHLTVELHEVHRGPLLKPAKVPLGGIPSLYCISCTIQLDVFCKLLAGALGTPGYIINKDIEQ